ncbi:MAG: PIN domain-containing protein [Nitrospirae bacterium]|nr:PIN domain-containing protein [Nitrospirota bacterium]
MYYLDTSVLLAYTLAQAAEPERAEAVRQLIERLTTDDRGMVTSFYALHEVFLFALEQAPTDEIGNSFGKAALVEIVSLPIRLLPLLTRSERTTHSRKFSALPDPSDVPHAISAYLSNCRVVIAYDDHFKRLASPLIYKTPEKLFEEL